VGPGSSRGRVETLRFKTSLTPGALTPVTKRQAIRPLKFDPDRRRFCVKIALPQDEDACWQWKGAANDSGYGYFGFEGKMQLAHRVSYQIFNGGIAPGLHVCHSCDNRLCVRPDHLWLGTAKNNMNDRDAKGRSTKDRHFKPHCSRGHPWTAETTFRNGGPHCRICNRERAKEWRDRRRALGLPVRSTQPGRRV
jgi:hypothetical protein